MGELISRVQASSANQPDWLQKKRQLAATLLTHFSTNKEEQLVVDAWLNDIDLTPAREPKVKSSGGLVDLPLAQAVKQYPAMCQENLMEKGLSWQDSQLNALHLALLNGGRFLYLPNNCQLSCPVELLAKIGATNYHTLIIIGSHCQLTIKDQRYWNSHLPLFSGVELLVGADSAVSYRYKGRLTSPSPHLGLHIYQAHGSQVRVAMSPQVSAPAVIDLQSNLDGDGSDAKLSVVHQADTNRCQIIVGVNDHQPGQQYRPHRQLCLAGSHEQLTERRSFAGNGED